MSADRHLLPRVWQVVCPVVVGRDAEIARLDEALAEARDGRGGLFLLVGEPGIGKSLLTRDLGEAGDVVSPGFRAEEDQRPPWRTPGDLASNG